MHQYDNTIERCPHDEENPYGMISRALIRDPKISPECRLLIIYLLSMKDGWIINMKHLVSSFKETTGRDKVYKMINEAINAGYIKREIYKTGGGSKKISTQVKYFVSERPKFKNNLPHPENQDHEEKPKLKKCFRHPENQDPENQDVKERTSYSLKSSKKKDKEKKKEGSCAPPTPPSEPAVSDISLFLFDLLKMKNPDHKKPNFKEWDKEVERMIKIDKRTPQSLKDVLTWAHTHTDPYWSTVIKKPSTLCKVFDSAIIAMKCKTKNQVAQEKEQEKSHIIKENKNWFDKATQSIKFQDPWQKMHKKEYHLEIRNNKEVNIISYDDPNFRTIILNKLTTWGY